MRRFKGIFAVNENQATREHALRRGKIGALTSYAIHFGMENRPDSFLRRITHKLGQRFIKNDDPSIARIKRRRAFTSLLTCHLSRLM